MPAPPARSRSASVPCGISSTSDLPRRRRDERDPVDRRRFVHLRGVHPRAAPAADRLRRRARARRADAADGHAHRRGRACGSYPAGCGRPRSRSAAANGRPCGASCSRPRAPACSRQSSWVSPGSSARPRRLILTALGNTSFNANPFKGKQDALPLFVYRLIRFPQTAAIDRAWTGAFVLLGLVLVLFVVARLIGGRGPGTSAASSALRLAQKGSRLSSPTRSTCRPHDAASSRDDVAPGSRRRDVSAWFGDHKVLERVTLEMKAEPGHRADRSVGLRQVDVPADPQPHARARTERVARRHGSHRRRRHLPLGAARHRHPPPHRHGVPEAEPVPRDDRSPRTSSPGLKLARQRANRARHPTDRRELPTPRRALERSEEPARHGRRRALRRSAAAPVHRPCARRASPTSC